MSLVVAIGRAPVAAQAGLVGSEPGLAASGTGRYVVTLGETDESIKAHVFDPRGKPQGPAFDVSASLQDKNRPDVAVLANGSFVVVFTALFSLTNAAINARRFDADGDLPRDFSSTYR